MQMKEKAAAPGSSQSDGVIVPQRERQKDTRSTAKRQRRSGAIAWVADPNGERPVHLAGRELWALRCLIAAGEDGITSISNPAPRLAAYIHKLRGHGISIETTHEPHGGEFSGLHGRYFLRSKVRLEETHEAR